MTPPSYIGVMIKNANSQGNAQGAGTLSDEIDEKVKSLTVEDVEKWMIDDLGRARAFLQAIHDDPNLCRLVAVHMHGKAQNYLRAKESKAAVGLPV